MTKPKQADEPIEHQIQWANGYAKGRSNSFNGRIYRPQLHEYNFNQGVSDGLKVQGKALPALEMHLLLEKKP